MRVVHLARKPLNGTVAQNVIEHGAGAINVDGSRVDTADTVRTHSRSPEASAKENRNIYGEYGPLTTHQTEGQKLGRWPANLVIEHKDGCRPTGTKRVRTATNSIGSAKGKRVNNDGPVGTATFVHSTIPSGDYLNEDGTETVVAWECEAGCPVADIDEQTGILHPRGNRNPSTGGGGGGGYTVSPGPAIPTGHHARPELKQKGGASRFYLQVGGDR